MCVPLLFQEKVCVGALLVANKKRTPGGIFDQEDMAIARSLCAQAAAPLHSMLALNAQRHMGGEAHAVTQQLVVVSWATASLEDFGSILGALMRSVRGQRARIAFVDESSPGELHAWEAQSCSREGEAQEMRYEKIYLSADDVFAQAAATLQSVSVASHAEARQFPSLLADSIGSASYSSQGLPSPSVLCVPLVQGARLVGIVEVRDRTGSPRFTGPEMHCIKALGALIVAHTTVVATKEAAMVMQSAVRVGLVDLLSRCTTNADRITAMLSTARDLCGASSVALLWAPEEPPPELSGTPGAGPDWQPAQRITLEENTLALAYQTVTIDDTLSAAVMLGGDDVSMEVSTYPSVRRTGSGLASGSLQKLTSGVDHDADIIPTTIGFIPLYTNSSRPCALLQLFNKHTPSLTPSAAAAFSQQDLAGAFFVASAATAWLQDPHCSTETSTSVKALVNYGTAAVAPPDSHCELEPKSRPSTAQVPAKVNEAAVWSKMVQGAQQEAHLERQLQVAQEAAVDEEARHSQK